MSFCRESEAPYRTVQGEAKNLALCIFKKIRRARSFAAPCTVRYGAALRMTPVESFSAAC
jgi:hypothetical protein